MNPEIVLSFLYSIFGDLLPYVAAFIFGLCLLAATAVLVVKALSFRS